MTHRLVFEDILEWETYRGLIMYQQEEGFWVPKKGFDVVVIGEAYRNDGEYSEDGDLIKEPTQCTGFMIDFLGEMPKELEPFAIEVKQPIHRFLGVE